ncbi:MAG: immune inhibitor A [Fibrobacteraceae bacterium]|nr:immune inhibitor A [Fibrobacteraceae bacterium]
MKHISFTLFCVLGASLAVARPPLPFPVEKMQQDGSSVLVQEYGDDNYHYETTVDGYLVVPDSSGNRVYANENGEPSQFKARNADKRSDEEKGFLKKLNPEKVKIHHREKHPDKYPDQQKRLNEGFKTNHKVFDNEGLDQSFNSADSSDIPVPLMRPPVEKFVKGETYFPIFLISSTDRKWSDSDIAEFKRFLNEKDYAYKNSTEYKGSIRDYFLKTSVDQFKPTFDVYPITVNMPMSTAGSDEDKFMKAVVAAGYTAIGQGNMSKYDSDGDKIVDGFGSVIAGPEEGSGLWGHMYWYSVYEPWQRNYGGYGFDKYFLVAQTAENSCLNGLAVVTHEFSHVLGLPDFYSSYNGENVPGPEPYDIMTAGMYNGYVGQCYGWAPPLYNAFERESMGWLKLKELSSSDQVYSLGNINTNEAYSITNPSNKDEYYVIEYRINQQFDKGIEKAALAYSGWNVTYANLGVYVWYINYTANAWEYYPNQGDSKRFNIVSVLLESQSNNGKTQFETADANGRTYSNFSVDYGVYNAVKDGDRAVCFSTKKDVAVKECKEVSSSSVASSSSTAPVVSSSSVSPVLSSASVAPGASSSSKTVASSSSKGSIWPSWSSATTGIYVQINEPSNGALFKAFVKNGSLLVETQENGVKNLMLLDMQGNLVKKVFFEGNGVWVELNGLRGAFVIRLSQNNKLLGQKVVLSR